MELTRRKICGEVRKAWTCEITWFLDQAAGLDEKLHYIVINDLILFDDEDPATYYIRVPGGTLGDIVTDNDDYIIDVVIDIDYVIKTYPNNVNEIIKKKYIGKKIEFER